METFSKWKLHLKISVATKEDPTWWIRSHRGSVVHQLIALSQTDVYNAKKQLMGQSINLTFFRYKFGICMRFTKNALDGVYDVP